MGSEEGHDTIPPFSVPMLPFPVSNLQKQTFTVVYSDHESVSGLKYNGVFCKLGIEST